MDACKRFPWIKTSIAFLLLVNASFALDPSRQVSQYNRQHWGTESELTASPLHAITQTPDGYLWIGTDKGLIRFDGFNFRSFPIAPNIADPNTPVLGLTTDSDGNLVIQPQGLGMLRYKKGQFETVETGLTASVSQVTSMFREKDGGVVFADLLAGTLRLQNNKVQVLVPDALAGTAPVMALAEAPNGKIWLGTLNSGLVSFYQGKIGKVGSPLQRAKINCLLAINDDEVWLGTDNGAFHWDGTKFEHITLPVPFNNVQVLSLMRDRDLNIWIGTAQGLLRINGKTVSRLDEGEFPIGPINAIFEDREGNVWIGGTRGLERIRDSAFSTYSTAVGLPSDQSGPVYVDSENHTWFAPVEGGLYLLNNGKVQPIRAAGLDKDIVYSIAGGGNGAIWIGRQNGGITRLRFNNGTITDQTYTQANGLAQNSVYSIYQARDGTAWVGTLSGGVSKFKGEQFVTYTTANGLGANTVASILESQDGTIWFATSNGLTALFNGQWKTYKRVDGMPSEDVNCLYQDSSGILWIGTSAGLAFFQSGRVQAAQTLSASLHEEILGVQEDKNKWLWISTAHHVLRVQSQNLSNNFHEAEDVHEYWQADGLLSMEGVKRNASVVADPSGKIWFSLHRGLSVVDPAFIAKSSIPALINIESVLADGKTIDLSDQTRIPPSPQRVTINYAGLSLTVPEHVRYRYRLDGFDHQWSAPVALREAVYTNLGPGTYHFRVIASNSDGTWSGVEQNLTFEVRPAFWQTWWFRFVCFAAVCSLVLLIYQFRLREATHQLNVRFEERLAERTRIAQELHDTLLQGVLSASMQLNVANDQINEDAPFKPLVTRVLELMGRVVDDGRNAVRGLRVSRNEQALDEAFSRVPQELAAQGTANFRVVTEGPQRTLHPIIRDEVYRIGREALVNAFRHSQAKNIEVELEYATHELIMRVRDDGCGIDPHVLQTGREGHWGLSGMRERAGKIGAKLKVWSKNAEGTEVELRIPARIAFEMATTDGVSNWFTKIFSRKNDASDKTNNS
jgi:signal transduction histidine kinase